MSTPSCGRWASRALLVGALVLGASAAWAAVDVAARLSRNTVAVGDAVELTIVVTGAVSGVVQPELPYLDGLAVISQSSNQTVSLGGGGVTAIMQYTYVLRADREGSVTVPAIAVQAGRQTLKTTPLTLTVTGRAQPRPPPTTSPTPPEPTLPEPTMLAGADTDVFATTEVDNKQPYQGQQVTLTFKFYNAVRLAGPANYAPPSTEGLVAEPLPDAPEQQVLVGERTYLVAQKETALFAPAPGEYTIGPAEVAYSTGFLSPEEMVRTKSIKLTVRPLPQNGRPPKFTGAVGQFKVSLAADKTQAKAGEALTAKVTVTGTGNLRQVQAPELNVVGPCKWYKSGEQRQVEPVSTQDGYRIGGNVTFEYLLIPRDRGTVRIGPVELASFDPGLGRYVTKKTRAVEVQVLPGLVEESTGEPVTPNIKYIKTGTGALRARGPLTATPWFWVVQLAPLLGLGVAARQQAVQRRLEANPKYRRFVRAAAKARDRVKETGRHASEGGSRYEGLDEALTEFVADKLGVAASSLSPEAAREALGGAAVPEELSVRVGELLSRLRAARFAPSGARGEDADRLAQAVLELVNAIDRSLPWR